MKLVIASDLHGAAGWFEKLVGILDAEQPDRLVLLGDLINHGPKNDLPADYAPKKIIELLNGLELPITAVRGNCDGEVDQMLLRFHCLADYAVIEDDGRALFCTHGHVWGPGLPYTANRLPALRRGDALLFGHTHLRVYDQRPDGIVLFNPGSVGIPREGAHSYGVYENGVFEHRDLI